MNHGECNPRSSYPDSFCGKPFIVKDGKSSDDDRCVYHSGYYKLKSKKSKEGVWTCCQADQREAAGCVED